MNIDSFILILSTIGLFLGVAITYWIHSQHDMDITVEPTLADARINPHSRISVIVPARNEARNIRRCIEALLAQTYPDYELIVVDDRSTDQTPEILMELEKTSGRLKVIEGGELPQSWAGKPHALIQGAQAAQGNWLCFIDADTFARPELLASTLECARSLGADMFTILTEQELGGFWEKVILPLVFTALAFGFPSRQVNDPANPEAIANGQFILIRREVYEAVRGHAAVKDRIDEDKGLAEVVKRSGFRLLVADGRQVAVTRMYTSLSEMWEGWTKNIYLGMEDRLGLLLFGAIVGFIAALALPVWLIGGVAWALSGYGWIAWVVALEAATLWAYLLWLRVQASRAFHISPWYALTLPLGALMFTSMMVVSAFKVLSGQGVTWRGRRYIR